MCWSPSGCYPGWARWPPNGLEGGTSSVSGLNFQPRGDLSTAYDDRLGSSVGLGCKGEAGVKRTHGMRFEAIHRSWSGGSVADLSLLFGVTHSHTQEHALVLLKS